MKSMILATALAALSAGAAFAQSPTAGPAAPQAQASIPFVNHGGIRNWQVGDRDTLYVQDQRRNWYRAELMGPCLDLPFAQAIGFETRGVDRFDRFSTIRVRGERCNVRSLVRSEAPISKRKAAEQQRLLRQQQQQG